ncbi:hypothetical protein GCM10010329_86500 [Streptomyces spiroverticillatus]|uniref:HEAT repeat domain-containing protein n=1 Tax=Streptomyces finlayi TaxID=67296 RepID=A0A919CGL2_9ACTN|nr:hypothetical protein [Streptomyces finlayi]GHA51357.1 hypothetical protein GCM10010329_86500 [Streptomyces spiroverticillatus]GHD20144.1 hypothetical protein GCM10010334_84380 [Streptomyces finlayi]
MAADVLALIGKPAAAAVPPLKKLLSPGYEWTRVHAAAALWEIAGEAESDTVLETLLEAWEENDSTSNHVMACLAKMGDAAAPALSRIQAELTQSRRSGRFHSLESDLALQSDCRTVLSHLNPVCE